MPLVKSNLISQGILVLSFLVTTVEWINRHTLTSKSQPPLNPSPSSRDFSSVVAITNCYRHATFAQSCKTPITLKDDILVYIPPDIERL